VYVIEPELESQLLPELKCEPSVFVKLKEGDILKFYTMQRIIGEGTRLPGS